MALHDITDSQVDALRALLLGGLNAELQPLTTEKVVEATYGWPVFGSQGNRPTRTPQLRLPALAVYRLDERFYERTMQHVETEAIFRIDYVSSACPLSLIDDRWPLLRRVWSTVLDLLCDGKHPSVSGGAAILSAAGFTDRLVLDQRYPRVTYGTVDEDNPHLAFRAEVKASHREDVDTSDLPALTLQTEVYPEGLPANERFPTDAAGFASEVHE